MERNQQILNFKSEEFWSIVLKIGKTKFQWHNGRIYDEEESTKLKHKIDKHEFATVISVSNTKTYKQRPLPLNTVEAQKLISQKLKVSPAKCMEVMEKLYNRGFLSYPRTETNIYHPTINLRDIIKQL